MLCLSFRSVYPGIAELSHCQFFIGQRCPAARTVVPAGLRSTVGLCSPFREGYHLPPPGGRLRFLTVCIPFFFFFFSARMSWLSGKFKSLSMEDVCCCLFESMLARLWQQMLKPGWPTPRWLKPGWSRPGRWTPPHSWCVGFWVLLMVVLRL